VGQAVANSALGSKSLATPGLWCNCVIKKDIETGLFPSQSLSFKAYKMYITVLFIRLLLKLNKNLICPFKATVDAG